MNPITCSYCQTTSHVPSWETLLVATFSNRVAAEAALFAIQKAHITLSGYSIFSKEEVAKKMKGLFLAETLVMQLHGIKDIVNLQALYVESICQEKNTLTFDTFVTKKQCEKLLQQLH